MPMRRLAAAVSPLLRMIQWMYSPAAPGVDLFLGLAALSWFGMMTLRPGLFDAGNYRGMQWAPDPVWIVFVGALVIMHLAGLVEPGWVKLRAAACLASAWYWICVAISLSRLGLTTGTGTYGLIGVVALTSAIYVSGRVPRSG